jgi:hypothetical protein
MPRSIHLCHQKPNPARDTVLLMGLEYVPETIVKEIFAQNNVISGGFAFANI